MKLTKKLILSFLASTLCSYTGVFASGIDHFEVTLTPDTAKAGEAIDLTIEAVDKNNAVVLDYNGTILIFSESDPEAELPSVLQENTYTFKAADQGKIKFENSVKFKTAGTQNIHIYDLNDDTVFGVGEALINQAAAVANIDISILSPEDGLTIGENSISVSGKTDKNHQVKLIVNGTGSIMTTSNDNGIFEKKVENLTDGDNNIKAQVLDADGKVLGESKLVNIRVDVNSLNIKLVKITPETVDAENSFEIEVVTNPGLTDVSVIVNDVLTKLEELKEGVYTSKMLAPKESGIYKIDVKIKDELGHEKTELGAASLTVKEVELSAAAEIITGTGSELEDRELKITGLKLVELKTKSILTWDKVEKAESYNIYKKVSEGNLELIENVKENKFEVEITGDEIKYDYFAVKAVAKTASGEIYEGSLSDATKVKTGPEILILFLLSLFIGGLVLVMKKRA